VQKRREEKLVRRFFALSVLALRLCVKEERSRKGAKKEKLKTQRRCGYS
jgi:hypothetical protein